MTEFLNDLPLKTRAKVLKLIDLLAEQGVLLKEPYTRQIRGKIRELRVKDHVGNIRVLYFTFTGRLFVLLHGFLKKTDKTPEREIEVAEKRMAEILLSVAEANHERKDTERIYRRTDEGPGFQEGMG